MKRLYYDLHIHSCLSPCGDMDMTPCNICLLYTSLRRFTTGVWDGFLI